MPELPEVETIVRDLGTRLTGLVVERAEVLLPKVVAAPSPAEFARLIKGREILGLSRRGKYILVELSQAWALILHLRMTGQLVYRGLGPSEPRPKHTHLVLHLDQGLLRFTDLRQFGRVWLVPAREVRRVPGLRELGVEPLGAGFVEEDFIRRLARSRRMIKPLLLDQTFLAGLGNIYTDEALYRAGIHPERPAAGLDVREALTLYRVIREVLAEGVAYRGTSVQHYVDGAGQQGRFQEILRVYGKKGVPCPACGTPVKRIRCGGRGTHFCPDCQPFSKHQSSTPPIV
ncbi:MAG: DNA-formamidopyrimidine glycosylase [Bacillota bacterium]